MPTVDSLVTARPNHKDYDSLVARVLGYPILVWYLRGPFIDLDAIFVMIVLVAEADKNRVGD